MNFLIIESLQKFHHYYGDDFKIECPTGSGTFITIDQVAAELTRRLAKIFLKNSEGERQVNALYPRSRKTKISVITCRFTSTSMETTPGGQALPTRPDGRASSPSC